MATAVSICSNALLSLGAKTISAFTEASDRARLCANLYAPTRKAMLRAHPWKCASKRVVLSPDVAVPAYGYNYQFSLPGDWARTISIGERMEEPDYITEGRKILTNESTLKLRYGWDNTDETTWDEQLVEAMTLAMASKLAFPVTRDRGRAADCQNELRLFLRQARAIDGQGDPPQTMGDFPLLAART